jgi:hypothetical protein
MMKGPCDSRKEDHVFSASLIVLDDAAFSHVALADSTWSG